MGPSCAHSRRRSAAHAGHAPWRGDSRALGLGRRRSSERPMRSSLLMRGCESCSTVRTNRQRHPSCPCIVWQASGEQQGCARRGVSQSGGRPCRAICRGICADLARGCDKTECAQLTGAVGGCGQPVQHATDTCRCNMQRAPAGTAFIMPGHTRPLPYDMKHTDRRAAVQSGADMHCSAVTCTICHVG